MATADLCDSVAQIGKTAGIVWHTLADGGSMSFARLAREVGEPRDLVMQAVGWLAREGKVEFEEGPRGRTVALTSRECALAAIDPGDRVDDFGLIGLIGEMLASLA